MLDWNALDTPIKTTESLPAFKRKLICLLSPHPPPKTYSVGPRVPSIFHTRLRLRHNGLGRHLHRIGAVDSPSCSCGFNSETETHYLLFCPTYNTARLNLLTAISPLVAPALDIERMLADRPNQLVDLLLSGSPSFSVAMNQHIFEAMFVYIKATNRFSITY